METRLRGKVGVLRSDYTSLEARMRSVENRSSIWTQWAAMSTALVAILLSIWAKLKP